MKLLVFIFLFSIQVFAKFGDWNSGGGYALTDDVNPWFIQNTEEVRYCIRIDDQNFGASLEKSSQLIRDAIGFWKNSFQHVEPSSESKVVVKLATQRFIEQKECSPETDIVFQLGLLDEDQKEFMRDPKKYIGYAVRTGYDREKLKGKGFVYISPEQGELAPRVTVKNRWSLAKGKLLRLTLAHELGHVFGLTFSNHPIMSPKIGYMMSFGIDNQFFESFIRETVLLNPYYYGIPSGEFSHCPGSIFMSEPHPFPKFRDYNCVKVSIRYKNGPAGKEEFLFKIFVAKSAGTKWKFLGEVKSTGLTRSKIYSPALMVLTESQKVFEQLESPTYLNIFEYGRYTSMSGLFSTHDDRQFQMTLSYDGDHLDLGVFDVATQSYDASLMSIDINPKTKEKSSPQRP